MEWYLIIQHFDSGWSNGRVQAIEFETEELANKAQEQLLAGAYSSFVTRRIHAKAPYTYVPYPNFSHSNEQWIGVTAPGPTGTRGE